MSMPISVIRRRIHAVFAVGGGGYIFRSEGYMQEEDTFFTGGGYIFRSEGYMLFFLFSL